MSSPTAALVRPVSPRLAAAELTHLERSPMDAAVAATQHDAYRALLADLGLDVVIAPTADEHPDGVFVEDTSVVVDDLAVVTRPGARSRRAETTTIVPVLAQRGLRVVHVEAPATLDGGDVLQVGATVFVGRSRRSNGEAARQLRDHLAPLGRDVVSVPVPGALHLKTAATALPDGTILAATDWLDTGSFRSHEVLAVPEPSGANALVVGETVVLAASAPATAALVAERGWDVRTIGIDQFERVEAGVTCLFVLLP